MVRIAIRCPVSNSLIYMEQCNETNKQRNCEASDCRPLKTIANVKTNLDKEDNPFYILPIKKGKKYGKRVRFSDVIGRS